MKQHQLDHVGIAVPSIDDAIPHWEKIVGATAAGRESLDDLGVEVVFIGTGIGKVELIAPIRSDSATARFLERRGPGMHHVCYRVADLARALTVYSAAGFDLIDEQPRRGAHGHLVAFLHPRSAGGVLVELLESDSAI